MNLSETTIQVLSNFKAINPNIVIYPGNEIAVKAESGQITASAKITEAFNQKFGIYDLNQFLSSISIVGDPYFQFEDEYVLITSELNRSKLKYFFSDPSLLTDASDIVGKLKKFQFNYCTKLTSDSLLQIKKAAAALQHQLFSLENQDGVLVATVFEPNNPTANNYSLELGEIKENPETQFKIVLSVDNLKMLPDDYELSLSEKAVRFSGSGIVESLDYYVVAQKGSHYG